jgi:hypothetical protein
MPTRYTAVLGEGKKVVTFREFALNCAHAFGALVLLRDSDPKAEIPRFEPSDYNSRGLAEAKKKIAEASKWSAAKAQDLADKAYSEAVAEREKTEQKRKGSEMRYRAMLKEVKAWTPPTSEHEGLKKFMVEQLEESIKFDCGPLGEWYPIPKKLTWEQYRAEVIAKAQKDVLYHAAEHAKEVERTNSRNAWVDALKESL